MCQFISWIEKTVRDPKTGLEDIMILFTTNSDLRSKVARDVDVVHKGYGVGDVVGHGFIRERLNLVKGPGQRERENATFKHPSIYPDEILAAIFEGRMTRVGSAMLMLRAPVRLRIMKSHKPSNTHVEFKKAVANHSELCALHGYNSFVTRRAASEMYALQRLHQQEVHIHEMKESWKAFFSDDDNIRPVWRRALQWHRTKYPNKVPGSFA